MAEFPIDWDEVVQRRLAEVVRLVEARRGSMGLSELNELLRSQCTTIEEAVLLGAELALTFAFYTDALVEIAARHIAKGTDIPSARVRSILLDETENALEQQVEGGAA